MKMARERLDALHRQYHFLHEPGFEGSTVILILAILLTVITLAARLT